MGATWWFWKLSVYVIVCHYYLNLSPNLCIILYIFAYVKFYFEACGPYSFTLGRFLCFLNILLLSNMALFSSFFWSIMSFSWRMVDKVDLLFYYGGKWVLTPNVIYIKKFTHVWKEYDPDLLSYIDICEEFHEKLGFSKV